MKLTSLRGAREDLAQLKAHRAQAEAALAECDRLIPALEALVAALPDEEPKPAQRRRPNGLYRQLVAEFAAPGQEFTIRELFPFVQERLPDCNYNALQTKLAHLAREGLIRRIGLGHYVLDTTGKNGHRSLFAEAAEPEAREECAA